MSRRVMVRLLAALRNVYGCPPHPAIYFDAQGVRRCTECHQEC